MFQSFWNKTWNLIIFWWNAIMSSQTQKICCCLCLTAQLNISVNIEHFALFHPFLFTLVVGKRAILSFKSIFDWCSENEMCDNVQKMRKFYIRCTIYQYPSISTLKFLWNIGQSMFKIQTWFLYQNLHKNIFADI